MSEIITRINDDENIKLSTDGCGNFSLRVCGYPVNGGEDDGIECVSILLDAKEIHDFLVKADLLLDGKIK